MPDTYKVHVSAKAERQLIEIDKYIADDLASPQAAERLLGCLQAEIISLPVNVSWNSAAIERPPQSCTFETKVRL